MCMGSMNFDIVNVSESIGWAQDEADRGGFNKCLVTIPGRLMRYQLYYSTCKYSNTMVVLLDWWSGAFMPRISKPISVVVL